MDCGDSAPRSARLGLVCATATKDRESRNERHKSAPGFFMAKALRSGFFTLLLQVAHLGVHLHVLATALDEKLSGLEVVAFYRELCRLLQLVRPFAERVAEPGRLGLELGQSKLFPDGLGAL